MNTETISGKFLVGDVAVNVECGFIPDHLQLLKNLAGTLKHFKWQKVLYDYAAVGTGMYGFDVDGVPTRLGSANDGFIPYDTSVESVMLPAPDGDGFLKAPSIADYDGTAVTYTARGVAALGSVVRPTVHNGYVYESLASTGAVQAVEPTWPTIVGDTVVDAVNTWICREERVVRTGVKGFTVGVNLCTDGQYWSFKAEKHSRYNYMGDARVENPVTFADHYR